MVTGRGTFGLGAIFQKILKKNDDSLKSNSKKKVPQKKN